jgi:hypothetical protein
MHRFPQIILLLVCLATTALADVPRTISYQGRLTDNGVPINGIRGASFKIYDGSGTPIWMSGIVNVAFTDGLFTVELGQSPQTPLPVEFWPSDTAISLGVTITPNPELSPRLRFKTVPFAIHALTAEWAASANGWVHGNGMMYLQNPSDSVALGTTSPQAKVGISAWGNQTGLRVNSGSTDNFSPALELRSETMTGAILRVGPSNEVPGLPLPTIFGESNGGDANAGIFRSFNTAWPTLNAAAFGTGSAIQAVSYSGYGLDAWYGKGIRAMADSATSIRAENLFSGGQATVLSSVYTGTYLADHIAVSGYSRPGDYYGIGGSFEGGYSGVLGNVHPDAGGDKWYFGVSGEVAGGSGSNYGVYGTAYGGATNYGVCGTAFGGTTSWAGYFTGDVRVTGNLVNPKSTLSVDHPSDPDNKFLQQADVVSDNLSAIYSGNITLGGDGSAIVQLPDYLESFCGDFRYQLTCVGGYAPVYVSSEISGNQFVIAGGKDGLKVSWQITGIRKDKYAQANPLEVEKKKTASEQGKYLHPELYGYSADRSLNPNPDRDPSVKSKNDAIRATAAALTNPSMPPKQPVMMEKK